MRLIDDAGLILRYAWSVRLMALAALLSGAEVAIQVLIAFQVKTPLPGGVLAALAGLVTVAAFAARFVAQRKVDEARAAKSGEA
jgi:putative flippase GtrA